MSVSERELIENCKNTDSIRAKEALYKHYYGYAMSICLRYSYSKHEAVMILNDSFMKVFDKIRLYDDAYSFKVWLRRILINTAIDRYRKNENYIEKTEANSFINIPGNFEDAISKLTVEDIMELLNELPETQRLIFNLSEIEGYSHKEISKKIKIPVGTSRSYLYRAKAKLRELFKIKFGTADE
jgi:RNA polymerase sigma-70 factor (ECF subfamily)